MSSRRRARLGEQLRRELSVKIQYLVRDPEVGPLSVTGVDVSADLWFARVYVEPQGSADEQDRTMAALGRAAPFLRSVLGRELHIRRMPELRFERDTSIEAGQRIESILREVLPARDAEEGAGRGGAGADHRPGAAARNRRPLSEPAAAMGMLLVDKPAGITSHDVVAVVRRSLRVRKAGHAGTLDPFATGLLVLGIGRATRLLEYLAGLDKEYLATARLGVATDSQDPEGSVTAEDDCWRSLDTDRIRTAAAAMAGRLVQSPPVYSAVKVGGVPAHRRVRRGEAVELPAREVTVHALEVLAVDLPEVRFRAACSSGTYVRSLAVELGASRYGLPPHRVAPYPGRGIRRA